MLENAPMVNLFILAAGVGSRLFPLTRNTPKSLLDLGNGMTLLGEQVESAISSGVVDAIYVVTGYRSTQIEKKIGDYAKKIRIETIYNPFFDTTNNLVSVWCAIQKMVEKDFIITNGDNLYRQQVLPQLAKHGAGIHLTTSIKDTYDEDDMKVTLDGRGGVVRVSKELPLDRVNAESVGLVGVYGEANRRLFHDTVVEMLKDKENMQRFWLNIFNRLVETGTTVQTHAIPRDAWAEVDFHPDIATIRSEISANLQLAAKLKQEPEKK